MIQNIKFLMIAQFKCREICAQKKSRNKHVAKISCDKVVSAWYLVVTHELITEVNYIII